MAAGSLHVLVTAGPTREHLDPVRYLSNESSGRMGFEIARAAVEAGHRVTLIAGPVHLETPPGVERVDVVSALDMLAALEELWEQGETSGKKIKPDVAWVRRACHALRARSVRSGFASGAAAVAAAQDKTY